MTDKELIKQEIERRIKEGSSKNDISEGALALNSLLDFIDSLPEEPASEDFESVLNAADKEYNEEYSEGEYCHEQSFKWGFQEGYYYRNKFKIQKESSEDLKEAASKYVREDFHERSRADFKAGAEWQRRQDEKLFKDDSWNYIEENYPNITQEEKLRLYDISIKSRLAGANTIKQHMKEALQTEYEKGRFDMREEIMKDAVGAQVFQVHDIEKAYEGYVYIISNQFKDLNLLPPNKVKIIIVKEEQQ